MKLKYWIVVGIIIMDLISYAKTFIGTRNQWGADGGGAFDCSGFVQEVLAVENLDPGGDQTAQQLFNHFRKKGHESSLKKRALLFFGKSDVHITHVAISIGNSQMIEAAGGGSKVLTAEDAIRENAMVRIRPILSRDDLISAIYLKERSYYNESD